MTSNEHNGKTLFKRPPLRPATLIVARTGERIKRSITWGISQQPPDSDGSDPDEETALLPDNSSPTSGNERHQNSSKGRLTLFLDRLRKFASSTVGIGVFKASIAYLLGSSATFIPALSDFLGHNDGKHIVATCTVYFHASRSLGSMFEAIFWAFIAFLYSAALSFTSMGVSNFFATVAKNIVLGHAIVLIVFCGGGLGLVGWMKQKLGNPLVNVACSLTSLSTITVLTKEGSVQAAEFSTQKVVQVLKMVVMGTTASFFVNVIIKPISARRNLRKSLVDVTDAFGDMLSIVTHSFLSGSDQELEDRGFEAASDLYKGAFSSLRKNLREGKWEHYVLGTESQYKLEAKLVKCVQRMSQHLGGLRSAANTQFSLLREAIESSTPLALYPERLDSWTTSSANLKALRSITEAMEGETQGATNQITSGPQVSSPPTVSTLNSQRILWADQQPQSEDRNGTIYSNNLTTARTPSDFFERFIQHLGPSMKSLAYTIKQILDELPCGPAPEYKVTVNPQFQHSLAEAMELYKSARIEALKNLYKNKELIDADERSQYLQATLEEVAASCGYFSYCLLNFAEEIQQYLDILDDLKDAECLPFGKRSWKWLIPRRFRSKAVEEHPHDMERNYVPTVPDDDEGREIALNRVGRVSVDAIRTEIEQKQSSFRYKIWCASRFFRREDVKFAVKVGIGAAIYALPSFLVSTRPLYTHWRGEWGLLSYMLVCSNTIGASNNTGASRIFGTCIGAILTLTGWHVTQGNVFAMAAFGWVVSLFTFYIIIGKGNGPFGRFIMLTYNLSALYAYSLSVRDNEDDDDEGGAVPKIGDIALHRVVAVVVGCLWGMVITRFVWPISARQKFREGLSLLLLRMGLIWKRDPLATLIDGRPESAYMDLREEFRLQKYISHLESLCASAAYEFELRGPFQAHQYKRVLRSVSRMLDAFHAMNTIILQEPQASEGEAEILRFTITERAQLSSRMCHIFQVMASSLKLEFPVIDALPSTEHARDRLLAKIFKFRKDKGANSNDEDYALLYAYALVTGQLSEELQNVGSELEELFGGLDDDKLKLL